MRQYAGYASAKESNERYKYLLAHGSTGLSMAFDLPTQLGLDSDDPRCLGEVGRTGVAIDTIDDMRTAFDGIPLDEVSTSMTINAPATRAAAALRARRRGAGRAARTSCAARRRTTSSRSTSRAGTSSTRPRASMRLTTDLFAYCSEHVPKWNTISISGYHFREKGCSAVQEVAFTLCQRDRLRAGGARRRPGRRRLRAAPGVLLQRPQQRLPGGREVPRGPADVGAHHARALRREGPERSMMLRFHTQTGGVTLTAQQPQNNIVRVALQGFAAVCGGTQSLHTNGYDEALALPSERAAKIALRTQQIIAARVRRDRHRRPVRGLLLRRGADRRDRARALRADRQGRRARRLGPRDRVHHERDRRVRLGLPGALPHRAGHRRRRQQVRGGRDRDRGHPARRPGVRARAARAPARVQGRPRPTSSSRSRLEELRDGRARDRQPAAADPRRRCKDRCSMGEVCGAMRDVFGAYQPRG